MSSSSEMDSLIDSLPVPKDDFSSDSDELDLPPPATPSHLQLISNAQKSPLKQSRLLLASGSRPYCSSVIRSAPASANRAFLEPKPVRNPPTFAVSAPSILKHPVNLDLSSDTSSQGTQEQPVQHEINTQELDSFVYPVNRPVRDYQRNIVRKALLKNLICALPTGLGKTFIASVVMLNWYRWTKTAKIVFVAPTRPLVSQQVQSFLSCTGISIKDTGVLIQEYVKKPQRAKEWAAKRVLFSTPQTVENDIASMLVDPRDIVCLVVDEAHRARGNYAYVKIVEAITEVNPHCRVLALTATPSGKLDGVQAVVDNLKIAGIEIRTEDSLDIRPYTYVKNITKVVVQESDEQTKLLDLCAETIEEFCEALASSRIIPTSNPVALHNYQILDGLQRFIKSPTFKSKSPMAFQRMAMARAVQPVVYAMGMLKTHGIFPFYDRIKELHDEVSRPDKKPGKYISQVVFHPSFIKVLKECKELIYDKNTGERNRMFVGHPKLRHLVDRLSDFFLVHGSDSRAIIFVEYREAAAEIIWMLGIHCPEFVQASLFVGQAATSKGVKGMRQKEQQSLLNDFKDGRINVLVATSIAEEGLDIGQVDLIMCYDQSQSPIRNIQRMGRTGRAREGNVIMLMTEKEKNKLALALDSHKYIQHKINTNSLASEQAKLQYHKPNRILPAGVSPKYKEVHIEVPPENEAAFAQGDILSAMKPIVERKKRKRKAKEVEISSPKRGEIRSALDELLNPSKKSSQDSDSAGAAGMASSEYSAESS